MRLTKIGSDSETDAIGKLGQAIDGYAARDAARTEVWSRHFNSGTRIT